MLTQHKETWFDDAIMQGWEKGQEEGLAKGWAKGREEERLSIARNLLGLGRPIEEIAQATGLEPEKIESLMH